jgi:hypothetical protein
MNAFDLGALFELNYQWLDLISLEIIALHYSKNNQNNNLWFLRWKSSLLDRFKYGLNI